MEGGKMDSTELKQEVKEAMKEFIKILNEEYGYSIEHAKTLLISKVMDSAYEFSQATAGR
jgi:hypothetical protein